MTMDVAVDPDVSFLVFSYLFEERFYTENFRLKILVWVYPLAVQIDSGNRVSVVTTDNTVGVKAGYKNESIKPAKELGLFFITNQKV